MCALRFNFSRDSVKRHLLAVLMPPRCAFCATPCDHRLCCVRCDRLLPRNNYACRRCANPLPHVQQSNVPCASCQLHEPLFHAAAAPLLYQFPVDNAVKALKFRRQLFYVPVFGNELLQTLQKEFPDVDGLVPVPLHRLRHVRRGFNQAHELCRPLRRGTGLEIASNVNRIRATGVQSELVADDRCANVRGAFAVKGRLAYRHPLIVDDVMTTGHTCNELSRTLLEAGAEKVSVLTVARARQLR